MKLDYRTRPWRTVTFELGHNEIDDVVTVVTFDLTEANA